MNIICKHLLAVLFLLMLGFIFIQFVQNTSLDDSNKTDTTEIPSFTYLTNDEKSITVSDGELEKVIVNYSNEFILKLKVIDDNTVAYLKCNDINCVAINLNTNTFIEDEVFKLDNNYEYYNTPSYLGGEYDWTSDGKALFTSLKDKLIKSTSNGEEVLLEWNVTNPEPGIGGKLCQQVSISPDDRNLAFCHSTATMNSIWGDLYVFSIDGKLIKELVSPNYKISKQPLEWINESQFLFLDSTSKYVCLLDITTMSLEQLFEFNTSEVRLIENKSIIQLINKDKSIRQYSINERKFVNE